MGLYLSIGAKCQYTDTQEPSGDTSTVAERADLGTSIRNVVSIDCSIAVSGGDGGGDASTPCSL
jgi:hypothetical protein